MGATTAEKTRFAVELLAKHLGKSGYWYAGQIAQHFGVSRRTGQKILARARRIIAQEAADATADLAKALPFAYGRALELAESGGKVRDILHCLDSMRELAAGSAVEQEPAPDAIEFLTRPPKPPPGERADDPSIN